MWCRFTLFFILFAINGFSQGYQNAVSTAHPLATDVGVTILQKGGNAFDAGVAVHFALSVVLPRAGNIGGGGFAVGFEPKEGAFALDFRETAPKMATSSLFFNKNAELIPNASLMGGKSVGVPGTVAGMFALHQRYGQLPWAEVLQPAIDLAKKLTLTKGEALHLNQYRSFLSQFNSRHCPFLPIDTFVAGAQMQQIQLAKTLKKIAQKGPDAFYKGNIARAMQKVVAKQSGVLHKNDLKNYAIKWRTPIAYDFGQYTLLTMPPPSSGGIAIAQMLFAAKQYNWLLTADPFTAENVHLWAEFARRAYADRSLFLGDPDYINVPTTMLLDTAYLLDRFGKISLDVATSSHLIGAGKVDKIESFETTHFTVADANGRMLAITTTLNGNYGSGIWVPKGGFLLNNEMDDFAVQPGTPNQFGLIGAKANAVEPGKRMLSSMTPTVVLKNGIPHGTVGTPGGSTIIMVVYQTLLRLMLWEQPLQTAINAPRMHAQWLPDAIFLESTINDTSFTEKLKSMGHNIKTVPALGRMNCIWKNSNGYWEAAADTLRSEGTATGF